MLKIGYPHPPVVERRRSSSFTGSHSRIPTISDSDYQIKSIPHFFPQQVKELRSSIPAWPPTHLQRHSESRERKGLGSRVLMIFSAVLGDSGSIRVDHGDITIPSINN